MGAALTDLFMQVAAEGSVTNMTSPGKAIGATSFNIADATGYPTTTGFVIAIRQVDENGDEVDDTYTEWAATLSGTTVSLGATPSPLVGSDQVYVAGSTTQVYVPLSSTRDNNMVEGLLNQHKQDGSHTGITTDTLATTGNATVGGTLAVTGGLTGAPVSSNNLSLGFSSNSIIGTNSQTGFNSSTPTALNTTDFPPVTLTVPAGYTVFYHGTVAVQSSVNSTTDMIILVAADGSDALPSGSSNNNFVNTITSLYAGASIPIIGEIAGLSAGSHTFSLWGQSSAGVNIVIGRVYVHFMVVAT